MGDPTPGSLPPRSSPLAPRYLLVVGLTGNIASGKSLVAAAFAQRGATVIDADQLARDAVEPGTAGLAAIVSRWGASLLASDGTLDRAALRRLVFSDPEQLAALNRIVHPEVRRRRDAQLADARARGERVVVCDIPLLFEQQMEREVDRVVLVDASEMTRLSRLVRERGLSVDEAHRMMRSQLPSAAKRPHAQYIIENEGSKDDLIARANTVWDALVAEAGG